MLALVQPAKTRSVPLIDGPCTRHTNRYVPGWFATNVLAVPHVITPEFTNVLGVSKEELAVGRIAVELKAIWKSVGAAQSAGDVAGVSGPATSHCVVMKGTEPAELLGKVAVWISKFPNTRTRSPTCTRTGASGYSSAETWFQKPPAQIVKRSCPPPTGVRFTVCARSSASLASTVFA
jgi:hypothetical protein